MWHRLFALWICFILVLLVLFFMFVLMLLMLLLLLMFLLLGEHFTGFIHRCFYFPILFFLLINIHWLLIEILLTTNSHNKHLLFTWFRLILELKPKPSPPQISIHIDFLAYIQRQLDAYSFHLVLSGLMNFLFIAIDPLPLKFVPDIRVCLFAYNSQAMCQCKKVLTNYLQKRIDVLFSVLLCLLNLFCLVMELFEWKKKKKSPKLFRSLLVVSFFPFVFNLNPFQHPEFAIEMSHPYTHIDPTPIRFQLSSIFSNCKRSVTTGCLPIFNFQ